MVMKATFLSTAVSKKKSFELESVKVFIHREHLYIPVLCLILRLSVRFSIYLHLVKKSIYFVFTIFRLELQVLEIIITNSMK